MIIEKGRLSDRTNPLDAMLERIRGQGVCIKEIDWKFTKGRRFCFDRNGTVGLATLHNGVWTSDSDWILDLLETVLDGCS